MKIDKVKFRELVYQGSTTKQLSIDFNVSASAIDQMGHRLGLHELIKANKPPKKIAMSVIYDRPQEEVRELRSSGATRAFQRQRQNAYHRGIPWDLSFFEWWEIWSASGHWEQRGREAGGWVMGRIGDAGAYAVGNVVICTHSENARVRDAVRGTFKKPKNASGRSNSDQLISSSLSAPVA